jgi:hypothetical protein
MKDALNVISESLDQLDVHISLHKTRIGYPNKRSVADLVLPSRYCVPPTRIARDVTHISTPMAVGDKKKEAGGGYGRSLCGQRQKEGC